MMASPNYSSWRAQQRRARLRCLLMEGAGWLFAAFSIGMAAGLVLERLS